MTHRALLSLPAPALGAWVYERRTALGLSQTDLAALAELDRSAVMYIEQGRHYARATTRTALWRALRDKRCPIELETERLLKRHSAEAILKAAEKVVERRTA